MSACFPRPVRPNDGEIFTRENGDKLITFRNPLDGIPVFYEADKWIAYLERTETEHRATIARLRS